MHICYAAKIASVLSDSTILVLNKNYASIIYLKSVLTQTHHDKYNTVKLIQLKINCKLANKQSILIKDGKLISSCLDKSLKVFDLQSAFLIQTKSKRTQQIISNFNEKSSTLSLSSSGYTNPVQMNEEHIIAHLALKLAELFLVFNIYIFLIKFKFKVKW
jgi:hypothetical protein